MRRTHDNEADEGVERLQGKGGELVLDLERESVQLGR